MNLSTLVSSIRHRAILLSGWLSFSPRLLPNLGLTLNFVGDYLGNSMRDPRGETLIGAVHSEAINTFNEIFKNQVFDEASKSVPVLLEVKSMISGAAVFGSIDLFSERKQYRYVYCFQLPEASRQ
jgi:hypothetical protein